MNDKNLYAKTLVNKYLEEWEEEERTRGKCDRKQNDK